MSYVNKSRCGHHVHDHRHPDRIFTETPCEMIHNKRRIAYAYMNKRFVNLAFLNKCLLWQAYVYLYASTADVIVPQNGTVKTTIFSNIAWNVQ